MAPLITITIKGLLASVGLKHSYAPTAQVPLEETPKAPASYKPCHSSMKSVGPTQGTASLSAISWAPNRMDIYGQDTGEGTISHKWWDGQQWNPSWNTTEDLGAEAAAAPVAVTWGKGTYRMSPVPQVQHKLRIHSHSPPDHMDLFSRAPDGSLTHKYWDSTAWQPSVTTAESLGGDLDITHSQLAATSWGENRLDVFGIGASDSGLLHKYYDGSQWQPADGLENLGNTLKGGVTAVSTNTSRLDVFATGSSGELFHLYYDGTKWSNWEDMLAPFPLSDPTVSSWGPNRLDLFGVSLDLGHLWHTAFDGSQWLAWEDLGTGGGDGGLVGPVAATSWGPNRIDIVALGKDGGYWYKYWDGSQWNPTDNTLYPKGGQFASVPTVVSWGVERLDIFGVMAEGGELGHQTWYGSGWYPDWGFEKLGGDFAVDGVAGVGGRVHKELR